MISRFEKDKLGIKFIQAEITEDDYDESVKNYMATVPKFQNWSTCEYCKAYVGKNETKGFCCGQGKVTENEVMLPEIPNEWRIWFDNDKKFRENLRKYNNCCALASLGFDSEERMPGFNPTLKISGRCGECDGVSIADRPFHFAKKCATSTSFDYYSNKLSLLLEISDKFTK